MEADRYRQIAEKYLDIVYKATYNYCKNEHDASDAVQNTFIKLIRTDTEFEDEEHIKKWLIRVAINECKSMWRSVWRSKTVSLDEMETDAIHMDDKDIAGSDINIAELVMKLPPKYSIVIHLYYYEGYNVEEIAQLVGITPTNVQTRLMRARNKLKKQVQSQNGRYQNE